MVHQMRWHVMIMMEWYADERIETLLDKIKVKLFYKVVNIIQGQYQEYMSSTTFSSVTNLRYFYTK
jgi:hypothetical protein